MDMTTGTSMPEKYIPADIEANVDRPMFPAFTVSDVASLGGGDHR